LVNSANDFFVSDITFDVAAPEPATYGLIGCGLLLLGFGQRRLSRRKS
jgi:hypothetical protein